MARVVWSVSVSHGGSISNDVKLTYLKTLVKGKAKCAIAEFAYCGKCMRKLWLL